MVSIGIFLLFESRTIYWKLVGFLNTEQLNRILFCCLLLFLLKQFSNEFDFFKPFPSPGELPNLGIEPRSPALQADSLPAEPQGKPKNTGVGNLSLLQQIFPTQKSNQGLLHYRQILYQLSYQGSPFVKVIVHLFWLHWVSVVAHRLSLLVESRGYSLVAVCWLPIVVASLGAEHEL